MKRIIALLLVLLPIVAFAQDERHLLNDSIDLMLKKHPYRFGIFRVGPKLLIDSGYDSNAYSISNDAILQEPVGDYYTSVAPGGTFALKLGRRGYFMIDEDLNFLYYKDLTNLRDIYNTTATQFVTGTRKTLLTLGGSYVKKKAPVNSEFDAPALSTLQNGYANFAFALRSRTDLTFDLRVDDNNYERIPGVFTLQPLPPDYRENDYGGGIEELFGRTLRLTFHAGAGHTNFKNRLNDTERDRTNFWNIDSGFTFTGEKLVGHANVGFEQRESRTVGQAALRNPSVDVDVNWLLRRHLALGVYGTRSQQPSSLTIEGFRLNTEGGARGSLPLADRFFVDGEFKIGNNNYNGDVRIQKDNYQEVDAGLDFVLIHNLVLRGGVTYYKRDSNVPQFNKNRTTFALGLRFELQSQEAQQ
jgi:hypothetical protein